MQRPKPRVLLLASVFVLSVTRDARSGKRVPEPEPSLSYAGFRLRMDDTRCRVMPERPHYAWLGAHCTSAVLRPRNTPTPCSLRGGAADDGVSFFSDLQDDTPWGESWARQRELQTAGEKDLDDSSVNSDDGRESEAGLFKSMLHCWRDQDPNVSGLGTDARGEDHPSGSGWLGWSPAHYANPLFCEAAELMRLPQKETNGSSAQNLLFWLQMQATEVVKRVSIPEGKERRQQALLDNLTAAVHDIWGHEGVLTPYGSGAAGFGTVESDLDLQLSLGEDWDANIAKKIARLSEAAAGALQRANEPLAVTPGNWSADRARDGAGDGEEVPGEGTGCEAGQQGLGQTNQISSLSAAVCDTDQVQNTSDGAVVDKRKDGLASSSAALVVDEKDASSAPSPCALNASKEPSSAPTSGVGATATRALRATDIFRTEAINVLKTLARRLRHVEKLKVSAIFRARVPILSILGGENDSLDMDISLHPLHNFGRFTVVALRVLREIDPRLRELVLCVKTWAQRRCINEAYKGTLNSFSLILMAVFLLQNVEPPILPNIFNSVLPLRGAAAERARKYLAARTTPPHPHKNGADNGPGGVPLYRNLKVLPGDVGGRRAAPVLVVDGSSAVPLIPGVDGREKLVNFHQDVEALRGWGTDNTQSVGELLVRFFAFFASEVSWASECVSVRQGRIIQIPEAMAPVADELLVSSSSHAPGNALRRGHEMYIQDFLDDSNNVARCVDERGRVLIQQELQRAWDMLRDKGDLEAVFQRRNDTSLVHGSGQKVPLQQLCGPSRHVTATLNATRLALGVNGEATGVEETRDASPGKKIRADKAQTMEGHAGTVGESRKQSVKLEARGRKVGQLGNKRARTSESKRQKVRKESHEPSGLKLDLKSQVIEAQ